ncbi:MAG: hypothetical protein J6U94_05065 [Paludibacteraceae bacterium]|nr:hypothetical protein [Paludibacteraceae bacterium]
MKHTLYRYIALSVLILGMMACSGNPNKPQANNAFTMDTPFMHAYAIHYGPFYEDIGITSQVFEMEFYTDGLTVDSAGYIHGTGYHLYITDLFATSFDSILPQATYTIDSINYGSPLTIMPGKRIGDFTTGAQLTQVGNEFLSTHLITGGALHLQWQGDTVHIQLNMHTSNNSKIESSYTGKLPTYYIDYTSQTDSKEKKIRKKCMKNVL